MNRFCSIFSQILQLFPRSEFQQAVEAHGAEKGAKGFSSWGQFIGMLFCQLGRAHSLREICGGLASCEGKLRHLGLEEGPKRSTLGYANANRPWELYQTVFGQLYEKCRSSVEGRGAKKFRFKNKLLSLDSSTITLSLSLYDWAKYRRKKGAVKLHLLLDHDGYLPSYAVISDGKKSDIAAARTMTFEAGTMVVFDRGYNDYDWFGRLTQSGVYFVTRMKEASDYFVVEQRPVPAGGRVRKDEVICLWSLTKTGEEDRFFRRIEYWDEEQQRLLIFLTNNLKLAASTIAAVYKDRWQIELFFKAIKQGLKIKTFLGTSENAVQTQIWTALITMLILRYLQLKSTFGWSLSNLSALLRHQLFVHRDLFSWLNAPFEGPPAVEAVQLDLGF